MAITNQSQKSRQTKTSKRLLSKRIGRKITRTSKSFQSTGCQIKEQTFLYMDLLTSMQILQNKYTLRLSSSPHEVCRRETVAMMIRLSKCLQLNQQSLLLGVYLLDRVLSIEERPGDIREKGFCALIVSSKFNRRGHPRLQSWANFYQQTISNAHFILLQAQILSAVDFDLGFVTYLQFIQTLSPPITAQQLQRVLTLNEKALHFSDFHCYSSKSRAVASSRMAGWRGDSEGEEEQVLRCEGSLVKANDDYH